MVQIEKISFIKQLLNLLLNPYSLEDEASTNEVQQVPMDTNPKSKIQIMWCNTLNMPLISQKVVNSSEKNHCYSFNKSTNILKLYNETLLQYLHLPILIVTTYYREITACSS
jgi:hypothetical protein